MQKLFNIEHVDWIIANCTWLIIEYAHWANFPNVDYCIWIADQVVFKGFIEVYRYNIIMSFLFLFVYFSATYEQMTKENRH